MVKEVHAPVVLILGKGRATVQAVSLMISYRGVPGWIPGCHVGFVVDKVVLGQDSTEYLSFLC
jgi:hypothetical protein